VVSLFSSIGYAVTEDALRSTLRAMAGHVAPGGVVIVEPWFTPERWVLGLPHMSIVDEAELKVCRINVSETEGTVSIIRFHYLVGTPDGGGTSPRSTAPDCSRASRCTRRSPPRGSMRRTTSRGSPGAGCTWPEPAP
jgi:hypothetical protein